jgi:hypothetical protein
VRAPFTLVLVLPFLACNSGVIYPERIYDEVISLNESHDGTGGFRKDVRADIETRCETVVRWHEEGLLTEPTDQFWAALTLTCSDHEAHLELAQELGHLAALGGDARGNLAYAHAQDVLSLHRGEALQRWGTEYRFNHVIGKYELYPPVDPRTTDHERAAMGIPPLRDLQAGIEALNEDPTTQHLRERVGGFED